MDKGVKLGCRWERGKEEKYREGKRSSRLSVGMRLWIARRNGQGFETRMCGMQVGEGRKRSKYHHACGYALLDGWEEERRMEQGKRRMV